MRSRCVPAELEREKKSAGDEAERRRGSEAGEGEDRGGATGSLERTEEPLREKR